MRGSRISLALLNEGDPPISRFDTIPSPGRLHCPGRRLIEAQTDVEIGGAGDRFGHARRQGQ